MILRFSIVPILVLLSLEAVHCVPISVTDAQQCEKLCSSCNGVVSFVDNRCECNIENDDELGTECLSRMRRQAAELGLDLVSCGDQRATRCTVGSKHSYSKNQIDQVAKYFESKGPMTGSVFVAPPFSQKSCDCVGSSSPSSGQGEQTASPAEPESVSAPAAPEEAVAAQPEAPVVPLQQMVSLQQLPQQFILTAVPPQQLLSSAGLFQSYAQPQMVASPSVASPPSDPQPQQPVQQPQAPEVVSSPAAPPSPGCSCPTLGAPAPQQQQQPPASRIITQPPETLGNAAAPAQSDRLASAANPKLGAAPKLQAAPPTPARQTVGSPAERVAAPAQPVPMGAAMQPYLMKALTTQLSQPMLGIPQAIHAIGSTPGISELVGAPAHLLNVFMQRMGFEPMQMASNPGQRHNEDVGSTIEKDNDRVVDNSCVGAENPSDDPTTGNQQTSPVSASPLTTSQNPTMGNTNTQNQMALLGQASPASGQMSYVPSMAMISSPMVGSVGPYNGFMPQMPTYIVGSPFGLPFMANNNMGAQTVGAINPAIMAKSSLDEPSGPSTAQSNPSEPEGPEAATPKQKKLCKKSYGQVSSRGARGVRDASDPSFDDKKDVEIEKEYKKKIELEQKLSETTTELPKIERTTTQKPKILPRIDGKGKTTPEKHAGKKKTEKDSS